MAWHTATLYALYFGPPLLMVMMIAATGLEKSGRARKAAGVGARIVLGVLLAAVGSLVADSICRALQ